MTTDVSATGATGRAAELRQSALRLVAAGAGIAGVAVVVGMTAAAPTAADIVLRTLRLGLGSGAGEVGLLNMTAVALAAFGLLVAGFGVAREPADGQVLGIAAAAALAAWAATPWEWDAFLLLFAVMTGVAAAAAILVALPVFWRRAAISAAVLYHFAGVLSAITSPHPTPWLTFQLWARVFRPHLEFSYVNNAYQFYSPQPGPANVMWFCIIGEDDQATWLKIPRRSEVLDPLGVEYYRRLSLTERANQNVPMPLGPPPEVKRLRFEMAGSIPLHPELLDVQQYKLPNEHGRQIIAGYARHVAKTYGTGRPDVPVRSVKVYLVQHRMLHQTEFAAGKDPYEPDTYLPFFVGEFDAEGVIRNAYDPMLYWLVPILKGDKPGELRNYVKDHAGSDPLEQ